MIRRLFSVCAIISALSVAACGRPAQNSRVAISVIGDTPKVRDANERRLDAPDRVLISATEQGLVRYDASGQIEPGLAMRWAISDDGLNYTFRLTKLAGVDAEHVARRLRSTISARSRNALKPLLGAIQEIVAVTPEVVEVRLKAPHPNLLDLLAQPEMAIILAKTGNGPFVTMEQTGSFLLLVPAYSEMPTNATEADRTKRQIRLRGERAGLAIARFQARTSDLVLGGSYATLAVLRAAGIAPRDFRRDPVSGLFGLHFVGDSALLAAGENRRAIGMAIDRSRLLSLFGVKDWAVSQSIVAPGASDLPQPIRTGWEGLSLAERRSAAAATIAAWRADNPDAALMVRLLLPEGPGSRILFAAIQADLLAIGIDVIPAKSAEKADLVLIDEVSPSQSATWYLGQFSCERSKICSEAADEALDIARDTSDPAERAARIAAADLHLAEAVPFIPLAQPLRWSLVSPRLTGFQTNIRGVHPLNHLIEPSN